MAFSLSYDARRRILSKLVAKLSMKLPRVPFAKGGYGEERSVGGNTNERQRPGERNAALHGQS